MSRVFKTCTTFSFNQLPNTLLFAVLIHKHSQTLRQPLSYFCSNSSAGPHLPLPLRFHFSPFSLCFALSLLAFLPFSVPSNATLSAIKSICFLPSSICHLLTCVILSCYVCIKLYVCVYVYVCLCAEVCACLQVCVPVGCVLKRLSFWALTLGACAALIPILVPQFLVLFSLLSLSLCSFFPSVHSSSSQLISTAPNLFINYVIHFSA